MGVVRAGFGAGSRVAGTLVGVGLGMGARGVAGVVAGWRRWHSREVEAGRAAWQDPWDVWGRDEGE